MKKEEEAWLISKLSCWSLIIPGEPWQETMTGESEGFVIPGTALMIVNNTHSIRLQPLPRRITSIAGERASKRFHFSYPRRSSCAME